MAYADGVVVSENQHWTGKRKAEAVLDLIKGKVSLIDFCRANDPKQSDVEKWVDDFVKSGTQGSSLTQRIAHLSRKSGPLRFVS